MIIGKRFEELNRYIGSNNNLDTAIHFILNNDLSLFTPGKYPIDNTNFILIREDYQPRDLKKCYFENHKNHLDIQIVLSGKEGFGYSHKLNDHLIICDEYNNEKDVTKFMGKPEFIFEMTDESFAIVYPEDIHMPKIKLDDSTFVKKAILKVKL